MRLFGLTEIETHLEQELKILHLEDNKADADLITRELMHAGMNVVSKVVDTREAFDREIKGFNPDVILSDHNLRQFNSVDALRIFKRHGLHIPFILVTGAVSEEFAVAIMKEGADDYILKQNLTRLPQAIHHSLDNKRLEKEKQLAVVQLYQKNQELSTLIHRCSHDLRGPLTSLMGLVQFSQEQQMNDTLAQSISMMEKSVRKLDLILKGFQEYAAITGDAPLNQEILFEPLVKDILESLENITGYSETKFIVDVKQTKPFFSNKYILRSMLQNLIHNTILYRSKNADATVNITISESGTSMLIEIKDNGIGIPEKIQDKVFEMFFRGTNEQGGSGLGLYLVKNAVTRLNGAIEMKSAEGKGTSFKITIP